MPNDQLHKLQTDCSGQGRSTRTPTCSPRPSASTTSSCPRARRDRDRFGHRARTFQGRWRTMMLVGRGIAGQVATPPSTSPRRGIHPHRARHSLRHSRSGAAATRIRSDGDPARHPQQHDRPAATTGPTDAPAYAPMGESGPYPAIAAVNPDDFGKQFGVFMGSGYSPRRSRPRARPSTPSTPSPATSSSTPQARFDQDAAACSTPGRPARCRTRWWPTRPRTSRPADLGLRREPRGQHREPGVHRRPPRPDVEVHHQSASGLGLIKLQPSTRGSSPTAPTSPSAPRWRCSTSKVRRPLPHVYWETGNDCASSRPTRSSSSPWRTRAPTTTPPCRGAGLFVERLEGALLGFRGTAQPATAFNATGLGRVFFIGTKFTDANVADGPASRASTACSSPSGAVSGSAVYDLDSSGSITGRRQSVMVSGKVNAIRGSLGQIVLDKGEVGRRRRRPGAAPPSRRTRRTTAAAARCS